MVDTFWRALANKEDYDLWTSSYFYGIFLDGALYETSGVNKFIWNYLYNMTIKRPIDIGIANFLDGK